MDIKNFVLTDEALSIIDNGTWVRDLPGADGVELLVCGTDSPQVKKATVQKQADLRAKNNGKPLSHEQLADCTREVLAEVVLKDWRGLEDGGTNIPYSKDLAVKWITSRNGERFAGLVLAAAQRVDVDAQSFVDAATKNLSPA